MAGAEGAGAEGPDAGIRRDEADTVGAAAIRAAETAGANAHHRRAESRPEAGEHGPGDSAPPTGLAIDEATLDELFERPPRPRLRIGVGAAVVLVLVVLGLAIAVTALQPSHSLALPPAGDTTPSGPPGASAGASAGASGAPAVSLGGSGAGGTGKNASVVFVHVLGAVRAPGVYELPGGSRIVDAVSRAGGLADDADPAGVNLARVVVDGEQVRIPRQGEASAPAGAIPGAAGPASGGGASAASGGAAGAPGGAGVPGALINLNTASVAELDALPRVGPVMAQRIVDYRTANGPFRSVDDLKQVAGIGDATFAGIAPLVTV